MRRGGFLHSGLALLVVGCAKAQTPAGRWLTLRGRRVFAYDSSTLLSAARDLVNDDLDKYAPSGDTTQCSLFVRDWFSTVTGSSNKDLDGQANDQFCAISADAARWSDITRADHWQATYDAASSAARNGSIVLAIWHNPPNGSCPNVNTTIHGHITAVMPLPQRLGYRRLNGGKGYYVPIVAQASGIIPNCTATGVEWNSKLSCAFSSHKQPDVRFFQYLG